MADKVQKIREEVARIQLYTQSEVLKQVLDYIDKVQKEPVSDRLAFKAIPRLLEMIEPTDRAKSYTAKLADALEVEGYSTDAKIVRESLKIMNGEKVPMATMDGEPVSEDFEKIVEEIAEPTILNAYGTKELVRRLRNTIYGISISEELEEASKEWLTPQLDKSYAAYGETKQMELTHFDGYAMLDAIEFGAQWQQEKDSIPAEYLEELINKLSKQFQEVSFAKLSRIAVRVAKWQKEQMMEKAIEGKVIANGMGNPILHLWDKGKHLIDKKVKVILIKED